MPTGHEGPHAPTRRPGPIDRRWEGDARPDRPAPSPAAAGLPDEDVERVAERLHVVGTRPGFAAKPAWERWTELAAAALAEMQPSPDSEADRLDPVCADCEDHGDGSYTCDPERSACPHARRQQGNDALKQRAKALLAPARAEMDSIRAALAPVPHDADGGERR